MTHLLLWAFGSLALTIGWIETKASPFLWIARLMLILETARIITVEAIAHAWRWAVDQWPLALREVRARELGRRAEAR